MNQDNIDIFICAHKDFNIYPNNNVYKIITGPNINISNKTIDIVIDKDTDIFPMEYCYAEGSRIYWIWKNWKLKDYIGICHYRSYFSFYNDLSQLNLDDLGEDKCIVSYYTANDFEKSTLYQQYNGCHYIQDLNDCINIIIKMFPEYKESMLNTLNGHKFIQRNMFIMSKNNFEKYCDFIFTILDEYNKIHNLHTKEDVMNLMKTRYKSDYLINCQSRLHGYLLERLTNIFINYNFKTIINCDIITTQENKKYYEY